VRQRDLGRYRVLHFATHAFVDRVLPMRSGLWLGGSEHEDGVLDASEIYALALRADLVVLSACDTGVGRTAAGEGVQSLARAFLYAGARSVVATLWQVDDRRTLELMTRFYSGLAGRETVATALAAARRESIARREPPRAWAGFVLIGSPMVRAVDPAWSFSGLGLSVGALLALLMAGAGLLKRRRPKDY
jgi:CHAT domain-containing protein